MGLQQQPPSRFLLLPASHCPFRYPVTTTLSLLVTACISLSIWVSNNNHPLASCYSLHLTVHLGLINNHPLASCYSLHLTVHLGFCNNHPLASCYSLYLTVHLGLQQPPSRFLLQPASHCPFRSTTTTLSLLVTACISLSI